MARNPGLWWRRLRHLVVVGVLMALLFVLESIIGCDNTEEPKAYYGPPPADDSQEGNDGLDLDAVVYYGPQPFDTVDAVDDVPDPSDTPQVYYGPQPVDTLDEVQILYGPQPVDVVDVSPEDVLLDAQQTWYGPPPGFDTIDPVDTVPQKDLGDDVKDDVMQTLYGPPAYYGPQPGE